MTRPDLSRFSSEEKDTLILALVGCVAALEAKLGQLPKMPGNSSLSPLVERVGNLIDNALKYAPGGGAVVVEEVGFRNMAMQMLF